MLLFISKDNNKITEFNNGIINVINPFEKYFIFPGIDGNFAFINILNRSNSVKANIFEIFLTFIKPNTNIIHRPFTIYRSEIPHQELNNIYCDTNVNTIFFCILMIDKKIDTKIKRSILKVPFLYSGLVYLFYINFLILKMLRI